VDEQELGREASSRAITMRVIDSDLGFESPSRIWARRFSYRRDTKKGGKKRSAARLAPPWIETVDSEGPISDIFFKSYAKKSHFLGFVS
jgi:hypothetical protein